MKDVEFATSIMVLNSIHVLVLMVINLELFASQIVLRIFKLQQNATQKLAFTSWSFDKIVMNSSIFSKNTDSAKI